MRKERIKVRRGSFLNISEKHVTMFSDLVWVFTRGGERRGVVKGGGQNFQKTLMRNGNGGRRG